MGLLSQRQLAHVIQIAREVLSNIARHAGAANVKIRALRQGPEMVLTFADDGTRFDPGTVTRGHGLDNVDDRAKKLRGTMTIRERPGAGMIHELRIPLRERQIEQT